MTSQHTDKRPRRRLTVLVTVTGLLLLVMTGTALAGPDPDRLAQAGWFCFSHTPAAVHCLPDGDAVLSGEAQTSTVLTWGTDTGEFWGTELLIHEDLYNGQPCPRDEVSGEPSTYVHLSDLGVNLPYYVCHHFESPLT